MSNRNRKYNIPSSYFDDPEDLIERENRYAVGYTPPTKAKNSDSENSISSLDRMAMIVIALCMGFWSIVMIGFAIATGNWTLVLGTTIGVVFYWGFSWFWYYIGWRFYWIMLALGWLGATAYMLTIFGFLQQMFVQFTRSGLYYR